MEHYVSDTELTIIRKPIDRSTPHYQHSRKVSSRTKMRREKPSGHHGKVTVYKVSKEVMEKLWVD